MDMKVTATLGFCVFLRGALFAGAETLNNLIPTVWQDDDDLGSETGQLYKVDGIMELENYFRINPILKTNSSYG